MTSNRTQSRKDKKRRAALRARLEAEGANPWLIEKALEQQRWDDLVARHGLDEARRLRNAETRIDEPDDRGFRPSSPDPLLTGAARVDGVTARVVQRRGTITRWQYDRMVKGDDR